MIWFGFGQIQPGDPPANSKWAVPPRVGDGSLPLIQGIVFPVLRTFCLFRSDAFISFTGFCGNVLFASLRTGSGCLVTLRHLRFHHDFE